jgi:hypothetical protein
VPEGQQKTQTFTNVLCVFGAERAEQSSAQTSHPLGMVSIERGRHEYPRLCILEFCTGREFQGADWTSGVMVEDLVGVGKTRNSTVRYGREVKRGARGLYTPQHVT